MTAFLLSLLTPAFLISLAISFLRGVVEALMERKREPQRPICRAKISASASAHRKADRR
jgi:hypothetical protein